MDSSAKRTLPQLFVHTKHQAAVDATKSPQREAAEKAEAAEEKAMSNN
jgi:hypothetical protein